MSRAKRSFRRSAAHFFSLILAFLLFSMDDGWAVSWGPLEKDSAEYLSELQNQALDLKLDETRYWKLLLHYQPQFFGGVKSEADGRDFFLSIEGRKNPKAELKSALEAFFAPEFDDITAQHPQCRFPERYRFLKEKLGFDQERLIERSCPRLEAWKKAIDPESMTLIFSSYYVNNPATMFGHTLLRFDKAGSRKGYDLLDYAVNYAANTGEDKGFFYAVLGLTGGYRGTFSTYPYYYKVQHYNNVDSRDIWEYKLGLSQEQVGKALNHLWELGATFFRYYFVDENCSYHLLSLLEVANPELDLRSKLHFFVAPSDTVKAVVRQPGLVVSIEYRPSKLSRFNQRLGLLEPEEKDLLEALISEEGFLENLSPPSMSSDRKALVADAAIELLSLRYQRPNATEFQRRLLADRSQIQGRFEVENRPLSSPPDLGHDSSRLGFGGGYGTDKAFGELHFRGAFHDLLADDLGYPENAEVEALNLSLRFYEEGRKIRLERFTAINIASLTPLTRFFKKASWNVSFGWETLRTNTCGRCGDLFLRGGPGLTLQSKMGLREVYYVFANLNFQMSPWSETGYRLGPMARGGVLVDLARWWKINVEAKVDYSPLGSPRTLYGGKVEQRLSLSKNWEIRLQGTRYRRGQEAGLALQIYY